MNTVLLQPLPGRRVEVVEEEADDPVCDDGCSEGEVVIRKALYKVLVAGIVKGNVLAIA